MFHRYELATLSCPLLSVPKAAAGARAWVAAAEATGTVLGCWRTEIGTLGRVLVLRGFADADELDRERHRALSSVNPFNAGDTVTALEMDSYAPFPFLPPAKASQESIHEVRTYRLKPGGLPPTLAGWEQAIGPAHAYVIAMHALDGPPKITHIWGFSTLEERASLRGTAYAAGVWPPKGGPENIIEATSTIALPV